MSSIKKFNRLSQNDRDQQYVAFVRKDWKLVFVQLEGWAVTDDPYRDRGGDIMAPVVYTKSRDQLRVAFDLADTTGDPAPSDRYGEAVLGVYGLYRERTGLNASEHDCRVDHAANVMMVLNSFGVRTGDAAWVENVATAELGQRLAQEWWDAQGSKLRVTWTEGSGPDGKPVFAREPEARAS